MKGRRMRLLPLLATLAMLAGGWQIAQGGYIQAKAWLAQSLLQSAWRHTRTGAGPVPPWPWADTWPVAQLRVARLGVDQVVLAGASGRTLAFGPGHMAGTAAPGGAGNSVISGHRDTHFRFLRNLRLGDRIELIPPMGDGLMYAVVSAEVYDQSDLWLLDQGQNLLTLITCYPFDALLPGGPGRFVVRAVPLTDADPSAGVGAIGAAGSQRVYL